jgi:hypothetical protein
MDHHLGHPADETLLFLRSLPQESIIKLSEEHAATGLPVGLDLSSGDSMSPELAGIWDNFRVKRQCLHLATVLATQVGAKRETGRVPGGRHHTPWETSVCTEGLCLLGRGRPDGQVLEDSSERVRVVGVWGDMC